MIDKVTQKLATLARLRRRSPAQNTDELAALERGYRELAAVDAGFSLVSRP